MTRLTQHLPRARKRRTVALWTAQIAVAAVFISVAVARLAGAPSSVEAFEQIGAGQWLRYVSGAVDLAGGIGLLIPRLAGLAALGLVGVMVGATVVNLVYLQPAIAPLTVLLGVVCALIAKARWPDIRSLLAHIRN